MNRRSKEKKFLSVLDEHKNLIYKVSHGYCSDKEERKDLVQEITFQLWRSFEKYDDSYKLSTWIYRIALNVSITHFRKSKVRSNQESIMERDFAESARSERVDEVDQLYKFINQFDSLNKALIILYLDGVSYSEMAAIMGISETNVATKLGRIKQKLREKFKNLK